MAAELGYLNLDMPTGLIYDKRFGEHDTGVHPERPQRLEAIEQRLSSVGLCNQMERIAFEPASLDWVRRVHQPAYIERLHRACGSGQAAIDGPDSAICARSYDVALLAVGGAMAAADAVMSEMVGNVFCALRPPGHHAERDRSMGFCLFNNVAITAEYLRIQHKIERVAIVDFDVHHGNGTQHIFECRDDVLFVSVHEDPEYLYPGTGYVHERGQSAGVGFTINLPMDPGSSDGDYHQVFEETVLPALDQFNPQALLVSAGFDAAAPDPLGHVALTPAAFQWMTAQLMQVAETKCENKLISLLEGGYDLQSLADCVEAHVRQLTSLNTCSPKSHLD